MDSFVNHTSKRRQDLRLILLQQTMSRFALLNSRIPLHDAVEEGQTKNLDAVHYGILVRKRDHVTGKTNQLPQLLVVQLGISN